MTVVIKSDHMMYLSSLYKQPVRSAMMRSGWFFLVLITFWQMIHCSLQTKIIEKAVLSLL